MRSWISATLLASALMLAPGVCMASSLQVSPVNIEVAAPGAASKLTVENSGDKILNAQIRVFKWVQKDGQDQLVETRDVVASPPALRLGPKKKSVVRVVRLNKSPAAAEESYRLIVDEIPRAPKPGMAGIGFAIRYSVPVFFSKSGEETNLAWTARISKGHFIVQAANNGTRRARLADLKIISGNKALKFGSGLSGYVLGKSSRVWVANTKSIAPGSVIKIVAQGEHGPVEATATVQAAN
jgi:fimbrial chaperone protein